MKRILILILICAGVAGAAWDPTKPADTRDWDLRDDDTRANFAALGTMLGISTGATTDANVVPTFNVQAFGADPTGLTDSTTAIQAATDAATTAKGTTFFPPGSYLISSAIEYDHYATFVGERFGSILIQETDDEPFFENEDGATVNSANWKGLIFAPTGTGTTAILNDGQYLAYGVIEQCDFRKELGVGLDFVAAAMSIRDCQFGFLGTAGTSWQAINFDGSPTKVTFATLIERCGFYGTNVITKGAIYVDEANSLQFTSCVFEGLSSPSHFLMGVKSAKFLSCNWENIDPGTTHDAPVEVAKNVVGDSGSYAIFENCKFQNNHDTDVWNSVAYVGAACLASFDVCYGSLGSGYYTSASAGNDLNIGYLLDNQCVSYEGDLDHGSLYLGVGAPGIVSPYGGLTVGGAATSAGSVAFLEDSDNGANAITLIGPASTGDDTLVLPTSTEIAAGGYLYTSTLGVITTEYPSIRTSIYTINVDAADETDDYQLDNTAVNKTEQVVTITGGVPAYAELVSVQLRCIEVVSGSSTMSIDVGTSSGGGEINATYNADSANDITGTAAAAGPELQATNAARSVYVNFTPEDNWSTLTTGRWALMLTYIDYGAVYTSGSP